MGDQIFYSEIILLVIEGYMEFVVSFYLQVTSEQAEWYWFSAILGILLFILFPGLIIWVARKGKDILLSQIFKTKWGALYFELKVDDPG